MKKQIQKFTNLLMSISLAFGFTLTATELSLTQPAFAETNCIEGFSFVDSKCLTTFVFSQGGYKIKVPEGLGAIQVEMFGGAGGKGGLDCGNGCIAAASGEVGHLVLNYTDLTDTYIYIFPGGAGADGRSNAPGTGGGSGGLSSFGPIYQGGNGGNAGSAGSSGAGGGGGAASVVLISSKTYIAAGAGGGGGSSNSVNGSTAGNTTNAYVAGSSAGGEGATTNCNPFCDGGGGGGGGAGLVGGAGGLLYQAPNGGKENSGFGGAAGSNTEVGGAVTKSEYVAPAGPGRIAISYIPHNAPQSVELLTTSPTNQSVYNYQVSLDKSTAFTSSDIVLSGSAITQGSFKTKITKKTVVGKTINYEFTVSEISTTNLSGDLVVSVMGVNSALLTINQLAPTATITLQPASARTLVHVFDVRTDSPVTNLVASDFVLAGTSKSCQISSVTGSGTYFQVGLSNCADGTFGLTLKKNSLSDNLGNQGPDADLTSELIDSHSPVVVVETQNGTIPKEFLKTPVSSIFGAIAADAQLALETQGIYAPMEQAPVVNLTTDLTGSTLQDQIAYQKLQEVEVGSSVDLTVTVSPEIGASSDLVAFLQTGNTWQFIGRTAFTNNSASASAFGIAAQGQYKVRMLIIPKTLVTNISFKSGFGKGLQASVRTAVTDAQTQLSNQVIDLTISAIAGANGVPSVVETLTPPPVSNPVSDLLTLTLPTINVGAPVANPGIGASGDDNSPSVPFNPIGSPEAIAATVKTTATVVAVVSTVAAAAGAAASAAAGASAGSSSSSSSSGSSASSSQDTNQQDGSLTNIDAEVEAFTSSHEGPGDRIPIFRLRIFNFLDKFTHDLTVHVARVSPVVSKIINDGAYLRAMFGSLWLAFPLTGIALATIGLMNPVLQIGPPDWRLFIFIAILGMFDAFSGLLATLIFVIGMVDTFGIRDISDLRMMLGVLVVGFGPALVAIAFRQIRKHFETSFSYFWERIADIAVLVFFTGWTVSSMVGTLPALAGRTLSVANHVADFGFFLSIAIVFRVVLEELAARFYPTRLDKINPTEVSSTSQLQKVLSTALRLGLFVFVTAAFMGNTWQVWVGSIIFILPNVLSWFQDRLPNSPLIWKLIPQGLPGLAFSLLVASYTALFVGSWLGHRTDYSQWSFILMPIPMFLVGVAGLFGREGGNDEDRPIKKEKWRYLYRVGGIVMLGVTLKLAGVI